MLEVSARPTRVRDALLLVYERSPAPGEDPAVFRVSPGSTGLPAFHGLKPNPDPLNIILGQRGSKLDLRVGF